AMNSASVLKGEAFGTTNRCRPRRPARSRRRDRKSAWKTATAGPAAIGGKQHSVAIGGRVRHGIECDSRPGTGPVLHDHLLAPNARQAGSHDPRRQVRAAAGRKADKQTHDARGIGVGKDRPAKRHKCRASTQLQYSTARKFHDKSSIRRTQYV